MLGIMQASVVSRLASDLALGRAFLAALNVGGTILWAKVLD